VNELAAVARRSVKFYTVGAIGIGVQLAALAAYVSIFHINYLLATALAVETALVHNFVWHERYTWVDRTNLKPKDIAVRLVRFNVSNGAVSILGNLAVMRWLVGQAHLPYFYANLIAIAVCSLANFLVSELFVFRKR
jgi:putative flippase GtrA